MDENKQMHTKRADSYVKVAEPAVLIGDKVNGFAVVDKCGWLCLWFRKPAFNHLVYNSRLTVL